MLRAVPAGGFGPADADELSAAEDLDPRRMVSREWA